ncbi:hypothetical protein GIB67_002324 [Kingdonia uniflora]|uniref:Uncharacterized protein n=1 Tax=Kingdonia uniflora TaxID=39325 RepID=A0A7J7KX37_9MAGN|nr:hypothetical protein GIB67_002324 [Kingdonia uniflora]
MMAYYEVVEQNMVAQIDVSWVFQVLTRCLYGEPRWLAGGRVNQSSRVLVGYHDGFVGGRTKRVKFEAEIHRRLNSRAAKALCDSKEERTGATRKNASFGRDCRYLRRAVWRRRQVCRVERHSKCVRGGAKVFCSRMQRISEGAMQGSTALIFIRRLKAAERTEEAGAIKAAGKAWYKTMVSDSDYTEFDNFSKWLAPDNKSRPGKMVSVPARDKTIGSSSGIPARGNIKRVSVKRSGEVSGSIIVAASSRSQSPVNIEGCLPPKILVQVKGCPPPKRGDLCVITHFPDPEPEFKGYPETNGRGLVSRRFRPLVDDDDDVPQSNESLGTLPTDVPPSNDPSIPQSNVHFPNELVLTNVPQSNEPF